MADLCVEQWPVERLQPYGKNPRKNDHVVSRMVDALREFGFRVPLLARSSGELIDGHLRYKAALAMGLQTVPVIVADDLSPEQVRAFRIMINRSATWADWDEELLLQELTALKLADFDLSATGFDDRELDQMLMEMTDGDKDPEAVPETPASPVSAFGDLWLLGSHRLLCGDATNSADCQRLLAGQSLDMAWTDPPYNVQYQGRLKKREKIRNDKLSPEKFEQLLLDAFRNLYHSLRNGGAVYVSYSDASTQLFQSAMQKAGFRFSTNLIWRKDHIVVSRGDYHLQHEPILYCWKPGATHKWYGDRKQRSFFESKLPGLSEMEDGSWQLFLDGRVYRIQGEALSVQEMQTTVIEAPKPVKSDLHPTMKPVSLIEKMLANSSPRGGIVGDFFAGSGSTLMACERLGRKAMLMELEPKYVDVIIMRWQEYTGQAAIREKDGQTWQEIKDAAV